MRVADHTQQHEHLPGKKRKKKRKELTTESQRAQRKTQNQNKRQSKDKRGIMEKQPRAGPGFSSPLFFLILFSFSLFFFLSSFLCLSL
jgi:hypothetical protein